MHTLITLQYRNKSIWSQDHTQSHSTSQMHNSFKLKKFNNTSNKFEVPFHVSPSLKCYGDMYNFTRPIVFIEQQNIDKQKTNYNKTWS